ncbi:MAG: glycerol-3-phosphate 1-O-acyltransferase PlsY [Candidatus Omnitrophica bacterium]|nr:glycerol-3-phosphate 1-O-acyltransferase PlsY [Candidatus Omnitrophota bacterium]
MTETIFILASYCIGGIPFAFIITKLFSKIDIRTKGSGNVGATNVLRVLGPLPGILVLVLDGLKGFLVIKFAPQNAVYLSGLAVIIGHCWTPFLKFKGGKGVAATLGVLAGLSFGYLGYAVLIWLAVFLIFKIISLASVTAAMLLPIILIIKSEPIQALIFITSYSALIIYRHKQNVRRLLEGKEKRIKFSKQ